MCTLITVRGHGSTRRCTATCYNARGPHCDCCCNGANHGKGLQAALQQTTERARDLLQRAGVEIQGDLFAHPEVTR